MSDLSELYVITPLAPGEVRVYTLDTGDRDTVRRITRHMLAEQAGISVDDVAYEIGPQGKPYLLNDRDLHFSISHSDDVSMIALTRVASIGVDVERHRDVPKAEAILRRFFPAGDVESILSDGDRARRFAQEWTRAEATVKVRGASVWEAATPDPNVTVRVLDAPAGYSASVAVADNDWNLVQLPLSI